MQYTLPIDGAASEMFYAAQERAYGGIYVECGCGIEHFAVDSRYAYEYDEDALIPEECDTDTRKIKHHRDCDSVGHFEFVGQQFVYGCESCAKRLRKYENFIWEERDTIRNYLKIRIDQEKKWADQEHLKNILAGIT